MYREHYDMHRRTANRGDFFGFGALTFYTENFIKIINNHNKYVCITLIEPVSRNYK